MVKLTPHQANWIKRLVYLADGFEELDLSELRIIKAWKDLFFECLCDMEELGLLKSIRTYPLGATGGEPGCCKCCKEEIMNGQGNQRTARAARICPVVDIAAEQNCEPTGEQLWQAWKDFFLDVLRELQQDGFIKVVAKPKSCDRQTGVSRTDTGPGPGRKS